MTQDQKNLVAEVSALTPADQSGGLMGVQAQRAIAEVQGAMAIAKRFPRDDKTAFARIMQACGRKSLAEVAIYEYPRGGQKVSGPSIRLAEALAQGWGNLNTGVIELERGAGESLALAYCVDLETNYRKEMTFTVPHTRDTSSGKKSLKDDRDIYERVANDGSRRLRNCILAVIPGDIVDAALDTCAKTLSSDNVPIQDRIRSMMTAMGEIGVTRDMIEQLFGCKAEALSSNQLVRLRGIFQSLKDGMGSVTDFFKAAKVDSADELSKRLESKIEAPKPEPKKAPVTPAAKAPQADDTFGGFNAPHTVK